ncbi:MAG TPA: AAA family ATPase [Cyclobacteriaceae bacterium]|nr:AAA family ATPase [Cyclobacteriaceae bacterium]
MDAFFEKFKQKLDYTSVDFVRGLMDEINWKARLIGIKGARGVGKTTLMLQYIKLHLQKEIESSLYVSLDNIWFGDNRLVDLVDTFVKHGGKYLFLDEVHKYPDWSRELKNIYDDYPKLKIVFTGSSLLEILNARADLSRRAVVYSMQGLSFREYLNIELGKNFEKISLTDILKHHIDIAELIVKKIKPLQYFPAYLRNGYYPFYKEQTDLYYSRLEEVINMMMEIELPSLRGFDLAYVPKLKQLLYIISTSVPFIPNVNKISERIGLNRVTLLNYLNYLEEIRLTNNIYKDAKGISKLQKPNKIFLENTNLIYALAPDNANLGNLRESFFVNQLTHHHTVEFAEVGDFIIDNKYNFEIGGKDKSDSQIKNTAQSYIAADDIEYGLGKKIPLWLFGFLY